MVVNKQVLESLCGGLDDLGQSLALLEAALLLEAHDLEAVEVGESRPLRLHIPLLGPVGVLPLLVDLRLLPVLLDGGRPCGAGQAGENEVSQDDVGERHRLAGDGESGV